MKIYNNYNLSELNTFCVNVKAKFFTEINNEKDLTDLFILPEFKQNEKMFLGGGSNVLFTKDFEGIVVLNKLKGIKILKEDSETVTIMAMGGEVWNDLVTFAVNHGYWGIENLSSIYGTVGAAPMQNIGAYGAEIKDVLKEIEAVNLVTGEKRIFSKEECELGYRESVFKNKLKGEYFILAVILKLSKIEKKNINYKVLREYLENNKIEIRSSKDISDAVASVRRSKLPNPKVLANAGSFFKNVFVSEIKLSTLLMTYTDIPYFKENGIIKIPSGWLIEQCGWKGKKMGKVGMHEKQALILVNYGGATGGEILDLANKIITSVKEKFDLDLIPEVNLI